MEFKLAKAEVNSEPEITTFDKLEASFKSERENIFYFDKSNSEKNIDKLKKYFEEKKYSVYKREIRFGLDDNDIVYEVHII